MTTENTEKTIKVDSKVAEFLKSRTSVENKEETPPEKKKVELPEDKSFQKDNYEVSTFNSFTDIINKVKATEGDKILFTKALLNDKPLQLEVSLFKGTVKVKVRSRSVFEQKVIMSVLTDESTGDSPSILNLFDYNNRMQQLGICIMVEEINSESFDNVKFTNESLDEAKKLLVEKCEETMGKLNNIKLRTLTVACAVFEKKVNLMENEAVNDEDFSNPADSD